MKENWWKESINKRTAILDTRYKSVILRQCRIAIYLFNHIPLEVEDIYNNVLFTISLEIYGYNYQTDMSSYIGRKCKFLAKQYCLRFIGPKHLTLNKSYKIIDNLDGEVIEERDELDLSKLGINEIRVIGHLIIKNRTKQETMKRMKISRRKLDKYLDQIRSKTFIK